MLAHSRKVRIKNMKRALGRMVERSNGPFSRRKEEIIIGSIRSRASHLVVNMENGIRFASKIRKNF
jgi:hypothetical protein